MYDAGIYEIEAWGPPVGEGVSEPRYCTLGGVAKVATEYFPHVVANEFICGRLGMCIGLPVPPGVLVRGEDGQDGYVSLRFGKKGQRPPGIIPAEFCNDHPRLAAGVIAFDCWIGNRERHGHNLAYSRVGKIEPAVFDHSHALLIAGRDYLLGNVDQPVVAGCLIAELPTAKFFRDWCDRITLVSDGVIKDLVEYLVRKRMLSRDDAHAAGAYLRTRKSRILSMIEANKGRFTNISAQEWSML